jgi:chaperone BCS1
MNFPGLQTLFVDLSTSHPSPSSLPSAIMDATVPGYSILSHLMFRLFGIDIGLVASGCLVVFALSRGAKFVYSCGYDYFLEHFTSSIKINDDDDLYDQILTWISTQPMTKSSRSLEAVSNNVGVSDREESALEDKEVLEVEDYSSYNKQRYFNPPRYQPSFGSDRFVYNGHTFFFQRRKLNSSPPVHAGGVERYLVIRCVGRSTQPVKDLLLHIKSWKLSRENNMTNVFRPAPRVDYLPDRWASPACRPIRPLTTVDLNKEEKEMIIADINEYLHPKTPRWYADRGIPLRRGYLFHGPPGTGKTSLSLALAGLFGLGVYVVSLNEAGLTETGLITLFARLPKRCVILLEDIDSVGLRRNGGHQACSISAENASRRKREGTGESRISFAGLLNVIDGPAAHEGRILIISTNYPSELDAALIRPGRVDVQIRFTLATHGQIRDIFTRMYTSADETSSESSTLPSQAPPGMTLYSVKVAEMACQFAHQLPENTFSPAEIQGYLLMKKSDPSGALNGVVSWRNMLVKAKADGAKVLLPRST